MDKQTVQQQQLNIWHEFDGKGDTSIEVLEQLCREYSSKFGVPVIPKVMNISKLTAGLQQIKTAGAGPQMALVPADMAGYGEGAVYSEIPEKFWSMSGFSDKDIRYSMRSNDKQYGIPILKGNHLVLYCNSEIYPEAPASWEAIEQQAEELMAKGIVPAATDLADPYCFIPFLTAFGGWPLKEGKPDLSTPEMEAALRFVQRQTAQGVLGSFHGSTELPGPFYRRRDWCHHLRGMDLQLFRPSYARQIARRCAADYYWQPGSLNGFIHRSGISAEFVGIGAIGRATIIRRLSAE